MKNKSILVLCGVYLLILGCATSRSHLGPPLSPGTHERLEILFRPEDRPEAKRLLVEECGHNIQNFKSLDSRGLERYRFAALKLSDGDLGRLRDALSLAKLDSRDLLLAADFGHGLRAHERWMPKSR